MVLGTARASARCGRCRTMIGSLAQATLTCRHTLTRTAGRPGARRMGTRSHGTTGTRAGRRTTTTPGTLRREIRGTPQLRIPVMIGIRRRSGCIIRTVRLLAGQTLAGSVLGGSLPTTRIARRIQARRRWITTRVFRLRIPILDTHGQDRSRSPIIPRCRTTTLRRTRFRWPTHQLTITPATPCRHRSRCIRTRRPSVGTRQAQRRLRRPRRRSRPIASTLAATGLELKMTTILE
mmetsp:Transcript_47827/g.126677  ORF Transcript_47827/g.126677 Transcript_47827/m.126677 type:complete len:235 (+) Transcript_47827:299-1003(+)